VPKPALNERVTEAPEGMPRNQLEDLLQWSSKYKNDLVAAVVHLNDTYLIDEREDRRLPGFARIIATVNRLRAHIKEITGENRLLVVHSGDFLFPSLLSSKYDKGQTMVKLLNRVGVDYCVLGNHEFDKGAEVLAARLREAKFKVLLANAADPTGLIREGWQVRRGVIWGEDERNPPALVALTGVVSADVHQSFESPDPDPDPLVSAWHGTYDPDRKAKWTFTPPNVAVIEWLKNVETLERENDINIPFRIVLTHATQNEDRALRRQIPDMPRTYILGGHDHDIEWMEDDKDVYVMKNLANAETVRVMLLLAGGRSVVREVDTACERLYSRRRAQGGKTPQYPQDLEAVLLAVDDANAELLRDRIANKALTNKFDHLAQALIYAGRDDMASWKLTYDDHPTPEKADVDDIKQALEVTNDADDGVLVRDFSGQTDILDARDGYIRRGETNLGYFVAECVRLQAGNADIAIINAGAFRCDSALKPQLYVRDLREAFLYDDDEAIMVFEVDSEVVDALLRHGGQVAKAGTGAFAQFSDMRSGKTGKVTLAITSYLLTRSDSNDGYDAVLHEVWGKKQGLADIEATRAAALNASAARPKCGIIAAIRAQAGKVSYKEPPKIVGEDARTLIELLNDYAETFYAAMKDVDGGVWSTSFRRWLGTDKPSKKGELAIPPEVDDARKKIRAFLRQLPAVKAYAIEIENRKKGMPAKKGTSIWDEPLKAAKEGLEALQKTLVNHELVFLYRHDFAEWFDMAARGIPGWFPDYPD
jgi:2',3'-cyclic-nucleotide 2'-phosphodiesterase (5'-nucleotidase family)